MAFITNAVFTYLVMIITCYVLYYPRNDIVDVCNDNCSMIVGEDGFYLRWCDDKHSILSEESQWINYIDYKNNKTNTL